MTNVILSDRVIDKSVDLKQKSEFCYGGGEGGGGAGYPLGLPDYIVFMITYTLCPSCL